MSDRDFTRCDICGVNLEADRMHVMIDNGMVIRNTYACRKHRYVKVVTLFGGSTEEDHIHDWVGIDPDLKALDAFSCYCGAYKYVTIQERTDREIESLSFKFRTGEIAPGWE